MSQNYHKTKDKLLQTRHDFTRLGTKTSW